MRLLVTPEANGDFRFELRCRCGDKRSVLSDYRCENNKHPHQTAVCSEEMQHTKPCSLLTSLETRKEYLQVLEVLALPVLAFSLNED